MDAYRIGVSIALANGVSPVLAVIARDLLGVQASIGAITKGFQAWKPAILAAVGVIAAGRMVEGLTVIAKAGGEVNHQLELMKIAGMANSEIQTSMSQAMKTSGNVLTTSLSENLKHIRELRYAFGETTTAIQHLDEITKANSVLNTVRGDKGKDEVWELVKSLEGKGVTYEPAAFSSYVDTMTKVVQATGGRVTPQMFMSTFKYGRTATLGWDEQFVGGALPRLIQSMASAGGGGGSGSGGPGNALMSAFAKVVQGQMPKTAAEEFEKMGLATATHIAGSSQSQLGSIAGRDLFIRDPYEWTQQILMPALASHGVTKDQDIIAEISKMMPVRTASQVITEMALQGRFHEGSNSPFEKDIRLQHGAMGLPAYDELIKNDYPTILEAFNRQWKNLLETLGSPLMQPGGPVISALAGLASTMGSIAQLAGRNAGTITGIVGVVQEIGSLLAKIDSFAIGKIASITGVSSIFQALGDVPWERIRDGIASFNSGLSSLSSIAWQGLVSMFDGIRNAISSFIDKIADIAGKVGWLFGFGNNKMPGLEEHTRKNQLKREQNFRSDVDRLVPENIRFDPGTGGAKHEQFAFALNIDGDRIAQTIINKIEDVYGFPTGAPSPDGSGRYFAGDHNAWDT